MKFFLQQGPGLSVYHLHYKFKHAVEHGDKAKDKDYNAGDAVDHHQLFYPKAFSEYVDCGA